MGTVVRAGQVQVPSSKCDGCGHDLPQNDQFCRYCGFSTKKCAACGKGPIGGGNFCPSCGAARGGQQVVRISPVSSRAKAIGLLLKYVAAPVIVILTAGIILAQPTISRSTAQTFFDNYFTHVENAKQRPQIYDKDLTTSFKQLRSNQKGQYNNFWDTVKSVDVGSAYSVSGNPFEFTLSFTLHYKPGTTYYRSHEATGGAAPVTVNYWFVCNGFRGNLLGKLPGVSCPAWALRIDNEQQASLLSRSG